MVPARQVISAESPCGSPRAASDHRTRVGEMRRERMRTRLIEAAMLVFARRGVEGGVIDEVIATAEVSRGSFYNHFRTHDELLGAVAQEVGNQLLEIVDPVIRTIADPAARVACGVRLTLAVAQAHPHLAAFLARVGPPALGAQSLATEVLPRDIRAGIESGRFTPMDPRLAFDLITGPVLAGFHTLLSTRVPAHYPREMAAAVLQALGVAKATARRLAELPLPDLALAPDSLLVRAEARAARLALEPRPPAPPAPPPPR